MYVVELPVAAGKKLEFLLRMRKNYSVINSIIDADQEGGIRLKNEPKIIGHWSLLLHRSAVAHLSLFSRYFDAFWNSHL